MPIRQSSPHPVRGICMASIAAVAVSVEAIPEIFREKASPGKSSAADNSACMAEAGAAAVSIAYRKIAINFLVLITRIKFFLGIKKHPNAR